MAFEVTQKVLFKHCDPAGIVFYPRYFEMLNDAVEAFFDARLALPFAALHREGGVPTAQISAQFHAPSRHGDVLTIALAVTKVGRSSAHLHFEAMAGGQPRISAQSVLVLVDGEGKATPWPADTHTKLLEELES